MAGMLGVDRGVEGTLGEAARLRTRSAGKHIFSLSGRPERSLQLNPNLSNAISLISGH
jgi:hypothetical protein